MPRHEVHTDSVKIDQFDDLVGDSALKGRENIVIADKPLNKDYLDELAFNEEPVTIRLEPSTDKNAATWFPIWVNGKGAEVFINLYPYNAGHLLICTYRHISDLTDLTDEERNEVFALTSAAMKVLRKVSDAKGFNLGMNQGAISGAGVADHIHQHVVPRWSGDANFMPIIGQTKVLPQLLAETRDALAREWNSI